jgi:hypothetical protein
MYVLHFAICCYILLFVYTAVPSAIKKKLAKGLPAQWRMMMKSWALLMLPPTNQK